jgi:hypothetical protein
MPRRERAKAKAREKKRPSRDKFIPEENQPPTIEEVAERTMNTLHNLGNQRFAVSPFSENLNRWLVNLKNILSEFESSPDITVDDQFAKERTRILSDIELDLGKRRDKEASADETFRILSSNKILLEQTEEDYSAETKHMNERKDTEIKRLTNNVEGLKEELDRIARIKTGIFRTTSKKTKAQKEAEAAQRLNAAQTELTSAVQHFTAEQEKLRDEHERKKQTIIEQIRNQQKEAESQETDSSLEPRRAACEALANAVNSFLQRKKPTHL